MGEKGHFSIPRIWLISIVGVIVLVFVVAMIVLIVNIAKTPDIERTNIENVEEAVNEVEDTQTKYSSLDEGIMETKLPKIAENVIAEVNSTIDGRIPCFYNPIIPLGFKAIGNVEDKTIDERAKWGEQNGYLYGLVIEDRNGNQFVWVPVENMNIFERTDWSNNKAKGKISSNYIEPEEEKEEDYYKMYYKVKKYGGFYVGRFETGDESARSERTEVKNSDYMGIKKYLNAYNYVPFTQTTIDGREITGAKELAINFGKTNNYKSVNTGILYGVQWDSILRFITRTSNTNSITNTTTTNSVTNTTVTNNVASTSETNNVTNSLKWGNYITSELTYTDIYGGSYVKQKDEVRLLKTGASEQTKAKNIYDIAGNLYEWTMETSKNDARIVRGGCYVVDVGQLAAFRYAYNNNTANNAIGFRISFYIN